MWLYDYTEEEQKTKNYYELYEPDTFDREPDGKLSGYNRWGDLTFYDKDGNFIGTVITFESMIPWREEDCYEWAKLYYGGMTDKDILVIYNKAQRDYPEMWKKVTEKLKKEYKTKETLEKEMREYWAIKDGRVVRIKFD